MQQIQENGDKGKAEPISLDEIKKLDKLDVFLSPWACDCGGLIKDAGGNCSICQANGLEVEDETSKFTSIRSKGRRFSTGSGFESQLDQFLKFLATNAKYKEDRNHGRVVGMYKFHCEIGCGGFSKVKLASHIFMKEQVAIKVIDKSRFPGKLEKILGQEVRCMEVLNHPNLIRLYEVIESCDKVHLVTELAPAGDLYMKVKSNGKLSEPEAKLIFRQIVDAILYMHDNRVYHRDIKAENVLFSTATLCKICDFGFSTVGRKEKSLSTFCGSPAYSAPELYQKVQYEGGPADAWSLGVVLYFMTQGNLPFKGNNMATLKEEILDGNYDFSGNPSKELVHLLKQILKHKPSERFNLAQIKNHPWLTVPDEVTETLAAQKLYPAFNNFAMYDVQESILSTMGSNYELNGDAVKEKKRPDLSCNGTKGVNYRLIPTKEQVMFRLVSQQEIKAYEILLEIGVSEARIRAHKSRGMRSYLIGIYRIILHKVQKGEEIEINKLGLPWGLSNSLMDLRSCGNLKEGEACKETEVEDEKLKGDDVSSNDDNKLNEVFEKNTNISDEKNINSNDENKSNSNEEKCNGSSKSESGRGKLQKSESIESGCSQASVSSQKKRIITKTSHVVSTKVCTIL